MSLLPVSHTMSSNNCPLGIKCYELNGSVVAIRWVNGECVFCLNESVFLPAPPACIRICVRGEKAPELVLELQDDERSQSFFSQVKRAKQQGEPVALSPSPSPFLSFSLSLFTLSFALSVSHFSHVSPMSTGYIPQLCLRSDAPFKVAVWHSTY